MQTYGVDYQETFAQIAKFNTVQVLLSIAVNNDQPFHKVDIKNAFLNGDLIEEVFMDIPSRFKDVEKKNQVCRLHKSLYDLKQSPRAQFDHFTSTVKKVRNNQG